MKLSKTTLIVLIVCILVFAAGCLGWIYSQQVDSQKNLETLLSSQKKKLSLMTLDDLNSQQEQLTQQIAQFNALLASNKTRLISSENSVDVTNAILELAKVHRIDITELRSPGVSNEELAGTNLDTFSIDLGFKGNLNDIANFAISLNERFPTSLDTLIQLDGVSSPASAPNPTETPVPGSSPTPEPATLTTQVPEKNFGGRLSLVIYNYKGN
jgi:hypothetical protein